MIYKLNWKADLSSKRLNESAGIMVNYLYHMDPGMLDANKKSYTSHGIISANPSVAQLADHQ